MKLSILVPAMAFMAFASVASAAPTFEYLLSGSVNVPAGTTVSFGDVVEGRQYYNEGNGTGTGFLPSLSDSPVSVFSQSSVDVFSDPDVTSSPRQEPNVATSTYFGLFHVDDGSTVTTRFFLAADPTRFSGTATLQSILNDFIATGEYTTSFTYADFMQAIDDGADFVNGVESPGGNELFIKFRDFLEGQATYQTLTTTSVQTGSTANLYVFADASSVPTTEGSLTVSTNAIPEPAALGLTLPAAALISRRRR